MRFILASLALATTAVSSAAAAQQFEQVNTATVSYADLDLGKAAGMATFNGRVRSAADRICRDRGIVPLHRVMEENRCVASVLKSAHQQIQPAIAQLSRRVVLASR
jgi:UrcA family protein